MIRVTSNATRYLVGRPKITPYISNNNSGAGMLRYANGSLEAYDGYNWQDVSPSLELELTEEVQEILAWARTKMFEDLKIKSLLDQHPGLREAHDHYEIMRALVLKENPNEMV